MILLSKKITLLGSTGSIGTQCLDVVRGESYIISTLAAKSNATLLAEQAREFRPGLVVIEDESKYLELKTALADLDIKITAGREAVSEVAAINVDTVVNAITGIAGLRPTLSALEAGNRVALANKETLVTAGELVMGMVKERRGTLVPIDSEHSAIWQCLEAGLREDVSGIILTASGGPFRGKTKAELATVTPEQALKHPTWLMGPKITIDSATLMNKGLEFIEAMWLFGLEPSQIELLAHPQSVIHSAVKYRDGSVIAQLGVPDMRVPISYALNYPRRVPAGVASLSLADYGSLTFNRLDMETFDCLRACVKAAKMGGLAPCIANGAGEQAVSLFLSGMISFLEIGEAVTSAVENVKSSGACTLGAIEDADIAAREYVLSHYTK